MGTAVCQRKGTLPFLSKVREREHAEPLSGSRQAAGASSHRVSCNGQEQVQLTVEIRAGTCLTPLLRAPRACWLGSVSRKARESAARSPAKNDVVSCGKGRVRG